MIFPNMNREFAFERVRYIVYRLITDAANSTPLSFDDAMSAAFLGAAQAIDTYDPSMGTKLKSWVYTKVEMQLLEELRRAAREDARRKKLVDIAYAEAVAVPELPKFDPDDVDWITEDVRYLVDAILEPSGRVERLLSDPKSTPNQVKGALFNHFHYQRYWTKERVREAMDTMFKALSTE